MADDKPFRLCIHIIRGTNAGRALSLMASGTQCVHETKESALRCYDDFLDAASAVLAGVIGFTVFGTVAVLNTATGCLESTVAVLKSRQSQTSNVNAA